MKSKNLTKADLAHMARVKSLSCGVCQKSGPSDAHHIRQGLHYLTIPLCKDCHQGGFNGIHGQSRIWQVNKLDEMNVLNDTIRKLCR